MNALEYIITTPWRGKTGLILLFTVPVNVTFWCGVIYAFVRVAKLAWGG